MILPIKKVKNLIEKAPFIGRAPTSLGSPPTLNLVKYKRLSNSVKAPQLKNYVQ